MKSLIVGIALAASSAVASAQAAPVTSGHGSFYVGPYAGYMLFGNLRKLSDGRSFSLENSFFYGGQAGYSFSPNIALLANLGYANSKFVYKNSGTVGSGTNQNIDDQKVGVYLYDADLQFKLPFLANRMGTSIAPFAQVGLGQVKYTYAGSRLNSPESQSDTRFTYNGGLGVDIQIRPAIGVRLMAKDYITSFDFNRVSTSTLNSTSNNSIANNIALTAGLNFGF